MIVDPAGGISALSPERRVLVERAVAASRNAQASSSGFRVGAALVSARGGVYAGANVESGPTTTNGICAEQSAIVSARTAEGDELDISEIVIYAPVPMAPPCGSCRQTLHDLAPKARVVFRIGGGYTEMPVGDLLPEAFDGAVEGLAGAPVDTSLTLLWDAATQARLCAYAPYSGIGVGAAVLTESGGLYVGCNVENAAYGRNATCAEMNAIHAARVTEGGTMRLRTLFTVSASRCGSPCGTCRQTLLEFASPATTVWFPLCGGYVSRTVGDLLPVAFRMRSNG